MAQKYKSVSAEQKQQNQSSMAERHRMQGTQTMQMKETSTNIS